MRWVISIALLFVGMVVIDKATLPGLGLILAGIAIVAVPMWVRRATAVKPVAVQQHTAHANARRDSEELRYRAEHDAKKIVGRARKAAERREAAALKAAQEFVVSEPRWVR